MLWMVVIDVLHCLDLGVSQDALGNLFYDAVTRSKLFKGSTQEERFKGLWAMILVYYKQTPGVSTPVQSMTWEMVKRDGKGPKLRTKGAETRGLIPFGLRLALAMRADDDTPYTQTLVKTFAALFQFYCLMGKAWDATAAKASCREFLVMYKALSEESLKHRGGDIRFWKVKPKFHMFQELGEYQSQSLGDPSKFWAYIDEDFVGWIAGFASSRGGAFKCASMAERTIQRYRAWVREL